MFAANNIVVNVVLRVKFSPFIGTMDLRDEVK